MSAGFLGTKDQSRLTNATKDWSALCSILGEPDCKPITKDVVRFPIHLADQHSISEIDQKLALNHLSAKVGESMGGRQPDSQDVEDIP